MSLKADPYCNDPYLTSYGGSTISRRLTQRYGQKYKDYRSQWDEADDFKASEFPLNIEFDLIAACNLRCKQCLRAEDLIDEYGDYLKNKERLSLETVARVMEEGRAFGLPSVNIGGSGEPMLHPDFLDICRTIMEGGVMELRIISNGTLLTEKVSESLIDLQTHLLSISLDALTEETYGKIRGNQGKFRQVMANIERFLELRKERNSIFPLLRVTFVRQEENKHETEAFVRHWRELADLVDVQVYCDYRAQEYHNGFNCTQPWRRLIVYPNQEVGPCCGFPGIVLRVGDFKEESLKTTWDGSTLAEFREKLADRRFPLACLKCQGTRIDV